MFGFNKSTDQNNSQSMNDSQQNTSLQNTSQTSINGYVSPYLSSQPGHNQVQNTLQPQQLAPQNPLPENQVVRFNQDTNTINPFPQSAENIFESNINTIQTPFATQPVNTLLEDPFTTQQLPPQPSVHDFNLPPIQQIQSEPPVFPEASLYNPPAPIQLSELSMQQNQPEVQQYPVVPQQTFVQPTQITNAAQTLDSPTLQQYYEPQPPAYIQNQPVQLPPLEAMPEDIKPPTVESLQTKQGEYEINPIQDATLIPEKDLVIHTQEELNPQVSGVNFADIKSLLDLVIAKDASDLHLTVGYPAMIRIDSRLHEIGDPLTAEQVQTLISQTLNTSQQELLEVNKEVDLSYSHTDKTRFRVNAYYERGNLAAAYRLIPSRIRNIEELQLPNILYDFTQLSQGLFLVTGPTGSGKSTTLAALLQEINDNYAKHIITVEDPIEYIYAKSKALVDQRELGADTHSWNVALRSILRQDPDIVLIGEMRDFDTIQAALTIAETGHLVFATLHTNSAAESIDRIIDVFPPHQQAQIRLQLSSSLKGILSQRLVPKIGGGREAATELMIVNSAIQNLIREGKTYQIDNVISTSYDLGMIILEKSLVKMIREGKISVETAQEYAIRPKELLKLLKSGT